jgi:signal recognition particle subunit SEC65
MSDQNITVEVQASDTEREGEPTTKVIQVENPTADEMKALIESIKINYDFEVEVREVAYNFKKSTDKDTGIVTERKPVVLAMPYPSVQGIVAILEEGGKPLELLIEATEAVVNSAVRDILNEDLEVNAQTFPYEKISWNAIAALPRAQRRGGGIPKETWEDFAKDYMECMPELTGKSIEQVTNAVKILTARLAPVKTNELVLNLMVEYLGIYAEGSPNASEFTEVIEFLTNKADTLLNVTEEDLLKNL